MIHDVKINTVLGPISPDELGTTLMHEHITFGWGGWYADETMAPYDREVYVKLALGILNEVKPYGVRTMVDATPNDTGRDVILMKEVSEKSGIHIICATGLYTEAEGASGYFKFRGKIPFFNVIDEMEELFVKEITEGIGTTGVKAGVIKVGTGLGCISAYEENVLRAAARAAKKTGAPIIAHTEGGTMGPEQAHLLISEGADPKRIVSGHAGGSTDLAYYTAILEKGVYLAFDRLGLGAPVVSVPVPVRNACIMALIGLGYTDRILFSHDVVMRVRGRYNDAWKKLEALIGPDHHPRYVFKQLIPALKQAGLTDAQVNTLMIENPRRLFAG